MTVIDEYLQTLDTPLQEVVAHMYDIARQLAPITTEELSYGMPTLKYKGKGLISIMVNKRFLSVYPFCAVEWLGLDLSAHETTIGSIHFSLDHPIADDLLREIIEARMQLIDQN